MAVEIMHPRAALLMPAFELYNEVQAGNFAAVAHACSDFLVDPERCAQEIAVVTKQPATGWIPLPVANLAPGGESITLEWESHEAAAAVDMYSRVLCGQWSATVGITQPYCLSTAMSRLRGDHQKPRLQGAATRTVEYGWPPFDNGYVSIASAVEPARLAYHAYCALTPGHSAPTFEADGGVLVVNVTGEAPIVPTMEDATW